MINQEEAVQRELVPGVFQTHYIDKHTGAGGVSMGTVTLGPGTALKLHTHKVEDAMVVVEGEGTFLLNGKEYPIREGVAVVAPAGMPHGLKNDSAYTLKIVYTWPSVEVERSFV